MQIDWAGLQFIEGAEGCRLTEYLDSAGKPTIGIGHLILPGEDFSAGITLPQAYQILTADLGPVQIEVNKLMDPSCNQNQYNALCSFCFNLGSGALAQMLSHGWDQVPQQMVKWVFQHVGGVAQEVPGLVTRRQAEAALFTS